MRVSEPQQRHNEILYDEESHLQKRARESNISNAISMVAMLLLGVIILFSLWYTVYRLLHSTDAHSRKAYLSIVREM